MRTKEATGRRATRICGKVLATSFALALCVGMNAWAADVTDEKLQQIEEANSSENILKNHSSVFLHTTSYNQDGNEELSAYNYISPQIVAYCDSDSVVEVMGNGEVIGYNSEQGGAYREAFMDDTYETDFAANKEFSLFYITEGDEIVSASEADGKITMVLAMDKQGAEVNGADWTDLQEDDRMISEGIIDANTLEVLSAKSWIEHKDGSVSKWSDTAVAYDTEPYQAPAELIAKLDSKDSRTITIIADAGTAKERTTTITVGKGCIGKFRFADGYERFYTDPACTQPKEAAVDTEADVLLYVAEGK